jgi:hypothetical protein
MNIIKHSSTAILLIIIPKTLVMRPIYVNYFTKALLNKRSMLAIVHVTIVVK